MQNMFTEEDLLPLSGLQHLLFCVRQCALIHIEQAWAENILTAEGRVMHERVHKADKASKGNFRVVYGMPLRSIRLGLIAKADVVEFHQTADLPEEMWRPFPVEYKRGKPKNDNSDKIQLCAQAICLEEMLSAEVPEGAIFYGKTRRRLDVAFNSELREETEDAAEKFHELVETGWTPKPVYEKKCKSCSLFDICMPRVTDASKSVSKYLDRMIGERS